MDLLGIIAFLMRSWYLIRGGPVQETGFSSRRSIPENRSFLIVQIDHFGIIDRTQGLHQFIDRISLNIGRQMRISHGGGLLFILHL
ncbi:hypothetical protein DESC_810098 [Desulfosarcina cetonica]|nr:hypothetical protein DESC_810098 [Desulfosarcina cetonica]